MPFHFRLTNTMINLFSTHSRKSNFSTLPPRGSVTPEAFYSDYEVEGPSSTSRLREDKRRATLVALDSESTSLGSSGGNSRG